MVSPYWGKRIEKYKQGEIRMKPKYRQPHSIKAPYWMNEALADKYIERRHHFEKYEARFGVNKCETFFINFTNSEENNG